MISNNHIPVHRITALLGIAAVTPVILFVCANVLVYELELLQGFDVTPVHPAVLLGGGFVAILLNSWSIFDFRLSRQNGKTWLMCGIVNRPWNLAVLVIAGTFLMVLLTYVIAENVAHAFTA